jgi:putrescine transport system substrate-binding protein
VIRRVPGADGSGATTIRPGRAVALAVLALALPGPVGQAEENVVNVYNWSEYIGKHTIAEFEQATGIKVVYDTFDSDDSVEAKVMTGGAVYDVISTSTSYFGRQIKAGIYRELDRSKLPNWKNLDPAILQEQALFDPGNAHAVPYLHGSTGFMYDAAAIRKRMPDAPVDSLAMLFDPKIVSRFQDCGVTLLDSPQAVTQAALAYLHLDPNTAKPEDFAAAERLLVAVRPYIRDFDSTRMNLLNHEVCIAMAWSGDYALVRAQAKAEHVDLDLAYTIAKEGAGAWSDAFLIPKGAQHPENAHKFLNFMLEPKVIAEITNELHYANDNLASQVFIDPAILADPAIYPPPEVEARLYQTLLATPETERLRTRIWTRVKTGF